MAFTNVKKTKRTLKALFIGPTGAGKTYPGLQLEGRIGAFDGEDGLKAYRDLFDFDIDPFDTIEELNEKLGAFVGDEATLSQYNSIVVDGMTVAWHAALREVENDNGQIEFAKQRDLKSGFKEFNDNVFKLGKRGKNVWVTAQSKAEWTIVQGRKPELKGFKGDVDGRIWYAFDLVCYIDVVNGSRTISILKSRYPQLFQVGDTIEDFDVRTTFKPIFDGTARYVEEGSEAAVAAEMNRVREQIKQKVKSLAAKNGGPMPNEDVKRLWEVASTSASMEQLAAALAEVRAVESRAQMPV